MMFRPKIDTTITLNQTTYTFPEHPTAKNMVYGQTGKRATVYQVADLQKRKFGLKVFKQTFQTAAMVETGERLAPFSRLAGLEVCERDVIHPEKHAALVEQYPELAYAVLMPWVMGQTWFDVLISKKTLTEQESRYYAGLFADMMAALEQHGMAHGDISGPNVMIDFERRRVALVDVEEMFGPGFARPAVLPSGTTGYAHRGAAVGLWSADADRFPGAVLLAEMLAQCDSRFRQECGRAESFFNPEEIQQDCAQFKLLSKILEERWGQPVRLLFEQAWSSPTFDGCPTFSQWSSVIRGEPKAAARPAVQAAQPPAPVYGVRGPAAAQVQIRQAEEPQSNQPIARPPTAPVVSHWREFKAPSPPTANAAQVAPAANPASSALYRAAPQAADSAPRAAAAVTPTAAPRTPTKFTVSSQVMNVFWLFAAAAVIFGLGIVLLAPSVQALKASAMIFGYTTFYTSGSTLLALLIGIIQAWVFKYRLKRDKRLKFILMTAAGGLIGGLLTGLATEISIASTDLILSNLAAGALMGFVGGSVSSLGQNQFLGNHSTARKWVLYSMISWTVIWGIGWQLSFFMPGAAGTALAAGFLLLASGAALAWLLNNTPEIEF